MAIKGDKQLNAKLKQLQAALQSRVPKLLAAQAERHFKQSFRHQGWLDKTLVKWRPTRTGRPGMILRRTGLLWNSIRIARADLGGIRVVAGGPHVPYAKLHNEGGTIQRQVTRRAHTRRAHGRNTPKGKRLIPESKVRRHQARMNVHLAKRQFMGRSQALERQMRATILKEMKAAFNVK